MGKNKKRSRDGGGTGLPKKKHRTAGFWIDVCRGSQPKKGKAEMTVLITQVDLTDVYRYVSRDKDESKVKGPTEDPTAITSLQTENESVNKDVPRKEPKNAETTDAAKSPENSKQEPTAITSLQTENESVNKDIPRKEPKNAETPDAAKSPENSKQVDYKHAFISIKRTPRASSHKRKYVHADFQPLPNGDCGDGITNPYPKTQVADKYWAQRRRLFSRFDDGIQLDNEGWFSVTPEAIANHISKRVVDEAPPETSSEGMIVLDAFCGCGGNAISFARRPEVSLVVCVDTDLSKLEMAAKNASVYNIDSEKLLFVHDNAIRVLSMYSNGENGAQQASSKSSAEEPTVLHGYSCNGQLPKRLDCIFLSPPWGGTDYLNLGTSHFFLKTHISIQGMDDSSAAIDGEELLAMAQKAAQQVVYFLPRNLNGIAMGRSALQAGYVGTMELEKNVLNGKFKTITAYLGFNKETTTSPS